jgi:hypothetical protein
MAGVSSASTSEWYGSEHDTAVEYGSAKLPGDSMKCITNSYAESCFDPTGDKWFIGDDAADGYSVEIDWIVTTDSGERSGTCRDSWGRGVWGECNKNYTEGAAVTWHMAAYDGSTGTYHQIDYDTVGHSTA